MSVKDPEALLRNDVRNLLELAEKRGIRENIPHFVGFCAIGTAATFCPEMSVAEAYKIISVEFENVWKKRA